MSGPCSASVEAVRRLLRARPVAGRLEPDAGSATVELAAAIPLLVAVTLAMVGILGLARDQILAQGAAREAAREAAIGGDEARASAAARAALPPGRAARITVAAAPPNRVRVSVALPVALPFGVQPVLVSATATAAREPGPPGPPPAATVGSPRPTNVRGAPPPTPGSR
jgi:Flp pilus assembly protein TadG